LIALISTRFAIMESVTFLKSTLLGFGLLLRASFYASLKTAVEGHGTNSYFMREAEVDRDLLSPPNLGEIEQLSTCRSCKPVKEDLLERTLFGE
jgi:hypothetical protein